MSGNFIKRVVHMKYLEFSVLHTVPNVPQNSELTESAP